jgi:bifunctional DNA-binding transcriptional regulator/antitoxin component of YhaV-PrlF toxin-antitoxin module
MDRTPNAGRRGKKTRPVVTQIVARFQVTVPVEVRKAFDLKPGDLLAWNVDSKAGTITVTAMRPQMLSPRIEAEILLPEGRPELAPHRPGPSRAPQNFSLDTTPEPDAAELEAAPEQVEAW